MRRLPRGWGDQGVITGRLFSSGISFVHADLFSFPLSFQHFFFLSLLRFSFHAYYSFLLCFVPIIEVSNAFIRVSRKLWNDYLGIEVLE